jgi:hypothetical protein
MAAMLALAALKAVAVVVIVLASATMGAASAMATPGFDRWFYGAIAQYLLLCVFFFSHQHAAHLRDSF